MAILLQQPRFKKGIIPVLLSLALLGCTNQITDGLKNDANGSSDFYLNKLAQSTQLEDQQSYKLLAARVLIEENKIPQSQLLINELSYLNADQKLEHQLVQAQIYAVTQDNTKAETLLNQIDLTKLSPSQLSRFYEIQSTLAENRDDVIAALKARIKIDETLTDTQRKQQNNDKIWALLRGANTGVINNASDEANIALGGWLTLIKIYNDNLNQPVQLSQALQNWKKYYPSHMANLLFPTELQSLLNFQQTSISQIGLILPLTGNGKLLGSTIQTGFNQAKGDSLIQVKVFDSATLSITDIINQAKQAGITTLVGPLLKQNLTDLLANPADLQGLKLLTLNNVDNPPVSNQICYYSLSPEDEAKSAATKMWNDGIRQPLVAVPQNELGQRIANVFNIRWQQLEGTDADVYYYNLPEDVKYAVKENNQAIYAVANSNELLNLKIALEKANRLLKIYASSKINASTNTADFITQMNGTEFSDIPFFKDTSSSQYQQIARKTKAEYQLMRLYSMGADAWLLINHFNELRQIPGFSLTGLTGKLYAGTNCYIERDLTWFAYQNGEIVAVKN